MYLSESYGDVSVDESNGYFVGKKYMDVTLKMWREDLKIGILFKNELYDDPDIPDWFLDKVL